MLSSSAAAPAAAVLRLFFKDLTRSPDFERESESERLAGESEILLLMTAKATTRTLERRARRACRAPVVPLVQRGTRQAGVVVGGAGSSAGYGCGCSCDGDSGRRSDVSR